MIFAVFNHFSIKLPSSFSVLLDVLIQNHSWTLFTGYHITNILNSNFVFLSTNALMTVLHHTSSIQYVTKQLLLKVPRPRSAKDKTRLIKPCCNKIIGDKLLDHPSGTTCSGAFVKRLPSLFSRRCSRHTCIICIDFFTYLVFHCYLYHIGSLFDGFFFFFFSAFCIPLYNVFVCALRSSWIGTL